MSPLRPDTQNFNRLIVSLGLIALALVIVGPWFFYRDTGVLTITAVRLDALTPSARHVLLQRQATLRTIQDVLPYAAGAFVLLGVGLLWWGGTQMKDAQTWEDRRMRARTKQQEASIEPQTPEEKHEEQETAAVEELLTELPDQRVVAPDPSSTQEPSTTTAPRIRVPSLPDHRADIARIENAVFDQLRRAAPSDYKFNSKVKVTRTSGPAVLLDGLLQSDHPGHADVVVDIKARFSPMLNPARLDADRLLGVLTRYRTATGRPCVGWMVLVFSGDSKDDWETFKARAERTLFGLLDPHATAVVIRESDIPTLELPELPRLRANDPDRWWGAVRSWTDTQR